MKRRKTNCGRALLRPISTIRLAFACLAVASPVLAASPAQKYQPSALWEWDESVITDSQAQATFFAFAASHGVNRVYIECESAIQSNQTALTGFLEAASKQGLQTELLFGDNKWVFKGHGYPHQGYAISLTSKFAAQLLGKMTYGKPVAVHYDVEPASLPQWKIEQNKVANDYIDLVTRLERAAHTIGLTLSVDVDYWYGKVEVTRHGAITPMNQLVLDVVDRYVIMDYWDTTARIESQTTTDLTFANGIPGKEVVIGVLTNCDEKPPDTSFCNKSRHSGTKYMESVLGKVTAAESTNVSYSGLAIEDYAGFQQLGP
ncbi:MAG TPA: hypothetical protein VGF97_04650 [Rhizomicrobium sp.]|jgi:hypothetical protein